MPGGFLASLLGRSSSSSKAPPAPATAPVSVAADAPAAEAPKNKLKSALASPSKHAVDDAPRVLTGPANTSRRLADTAQPLQADSGGAAGPKARRAWYAFDKAATPPLERSASDDRPDQQLQIWPSKSKARVDVVKDKQASRSLPFRHKRHVSFSVPEAPAKPDIRRHQRTPSGTDLDRRRDERPLHLSSHRQSTSLRQMQPFEHGERGERGLARIAEDSDRQRPGAEVRPPQPLGATARVRRSDGGGLAWKLQNDGVTTMQAQSPARMVVVSSEAAPGARSMYASPPPVPQQHRPQDAYRAPRDLERARDERTAPRLAYPRARPARRDAAELSDASSDGGRPKMRPTSDRERARRDGELPERDAAGSQAARRRRPEAHSRSLQNPSTGLRGPTVPSSARNQLRSQPAAFFGMVGA
ncbi:uncharacterized protein PFL1_01994 [Pseudozyma flocculosa PF-1]|uniref:Uncharacterized protein n=1 Tax=Pseudozyma flocculosa TaxID=84751 RepID=A0A5C3F0E9_9BASI|nr:uncharacterized protein PFL1_01994 [Pseudozyma flocculosa PF-1]EPQ30468.1 hypothetical protein PFL1_01994 [Pseudozyma flocculosa PF-1]SPO37550.1 uncharacterized protein PSFLO_03025 [Pseudozyma flocculosa]